jgi:hypothetical protein
MFDYSVILIVGMGVVIGILRGLENIKCTRAGRCEPAKPIKDKFVYVYMDFQ